MLVLPLVAVGDEVSPQERLGMPAAREMAKIDLFVSDCPLEAFGEHFVRCPPAAVDRHGDATLDLSAPERCRR